MKCRDFEELLSAYADGELAQTQRDFIEEHLAGCADCRATLARYRETGNRLVSLRTLSRTVDIKEATMSRVKSFAGKSRRWLRPAIAGAAAVTVALVLTAVFVLPIQSPMDALAKALAKTQALTSYRNDSIAETRPAGTTEWIGTGYHQVEYAAPGKIHMKSRTTLKVSATSPEWVNWEWITSDNTVYLWELTQSTISAELMTQLMSEQAAQLQNPMDSFKLLTSVKRLPDEKIDGVACLHYKGLLDMDKFIKQQLPIMERAAREQHERWIKSMPGPPVNDSSYEKDLQQSLKAMEAQYRIRQMEYEYWIGKDDGLLHQQSDLTTQAAWAHEAMPLSTDFRQTSKFYDFNQNIVIKPPLDDQGNLLPDWRIQQ